MLQEHSKLIQDDLMNKQVLSKSLKSSDVGARTSVGREFHVLGQPDANDRALSNCRGSKNSKSPVAGGLEGSPAGDS